MRRAALLVVVVVLLAACGDDDADPGAEAEDGVAGVVAERLDAEAADITVTCPEDLEVEPGLDFTCEVAVQDAEPVDLDLTVADDGTVELRRAVIPTEAAESYLSEQLAPTAEGPVGADCGDEPLLVADVGDELRCEVTRESDGAVRPVVVTVLSLDGSVRYRVEAPTTTTATTTPP